jgi:hypothetical protein
VRSSALAFITLTKEYGFMVKEKEIVEVPAYIKRRLICNAIGKYKNIHPIYFRDREFQIAYGKVYFWFITDTGFHGVSIDLLASGDFPPDIGN